MTDRVHTLPGEGDRGLHMARRLARTAEKAGLDAAGRALLERCHTLAMEPRRARLTERDPAFLHPGRSALVLLLDAGVREAGLLAATVLVDSEDPGTQVPDDALRGRVPDGVVVLRNAVPSSGDERLAERLITADEGVRLAALAERLDHLRHAHLWVDPERRRTAHREAADVYHPLAVRTHPALARRYAWWIRMFGRRHLGAGS